MSQNNPRIALVHALRESVEPLRLAFATHWPQAETFNVLDDSLSATVDRFGALTETIIRRTMDLARYAAAPGPDGRAADGMLITSSAFTQAIEAVKAELRIPVMGPYEAAFQIAVQRARRIGLLVTFKPSHSVLASELQKFANARGTEVEVTSLYVPGALESLQAANVADHNARIVEATEGLRDCELIIFGQFSMTKALQAMPSALAARILTTPECAVTGLRHVLGQDR